MSSNFSYILPGKLAGCARPGSGGDRPADFAALKRRGIGALVVLTEDARDAEAAREGGFRTLHLPIPDFHPPRREQLERFVSFVNACLADGVPVAVHCGAGMGRTGTMLAGYLVSQGTSPDEAMRRIRKRRPGSIETSAQEQSLVDYHQSLT